MARAEEAGDSLYYDIKEGLVMIQRRGRAEIGDKTMVDVWAPVVEDLKNHQLTPERIDEYILKTALLRAKRDVMHMLQMVHLGLSILVRIHQVYCLKHY